ncbi:aminomethyl transferase family protein [Desulfosporosinus fructosivorans]|uniref:Aminomethyl transferase family protein n=1 Tax=Desulfosporosinus fructosivorans TaxID=2018669 RepID=A0A4Z0QXJ3_9FIRM|nr:aminomethyltransferase family protein [Desulfosporosinus fructosivorans]TGE35150.1 aminomethyl transferase family protein [Desulfosporosinus fructosivorans]
MENTCKNDLEVKVEKSFPLPIYAPFDTKVDLYLYSRSTLGFEHAVPYEYSGWRDEIMSYKETCYLHAGLNPAPTYRVKGPDAMKFFADLSVNSFAKFPIGAIKHCIMCNEEGLNMADGVLIRVSEEEFISYYLAPYAAYKLETGNYNAKGEYVFDTFIFQLAGPRSLEILETVTGECLHDIKFGRLKKSIIEDMDIEIIRVGMAGPLAYEIHGLNIDARSIYNMIIAAGESFGIKKLGIRAYQMNHTEGGFPQAFIHFQFPWFEDRGFAEYLSRRQKMQPPILAGSLGTDMRLRYRNPVELGWDKMIKFDHDFIGRKALEREVANPRRKTVTLVWNPEDIVDVYASQFQTGEHYMPMEPSHFTQQNGRNVLHADQVLKDGKLVGASSGRILSYYYRQMISLCSIDTEYSELGTEVSILWGNPGTRQKTISATVSRFPYLDENRNEHVDVSTIPCQAHKK